MDNTIDMNAIDKLRELIRNMVREEISNNNAKLELHYDGVVTEVSADNTTASVDLGFTKLTGLSNCTGSTLYSPSGNSGGSTVRVYAKSNTLGDAYIGVRLDLHYKGTVKAVNSDNTIIKVDLGFKTLEGLSNRTGTILSVNDSVMVYVDSNTFTDAYVSAKLT